MVFNICKFWLSSLFGRFLLISSHGRYTLSVNITWKNSFDITCVLVYHCWGLCIGQYFPLFYYWHVNCEKCRPWNGNAKRLHAPSESVCALCSLPKSCGIWWHCGELGHCCMSLGLFQECEEQSTCMQPGSEPSVHMEEKNPLRHRLRAQPTHS